jgi:hypothetical protein
MRKAELAAASKGLDGVVALIKQEMSGQSAGSVAKIGGQIDIVTSLMDDARELGPSDAIETDDGLSAYSDMKQAAGGHLEAVARTLAGDSTASAMTDAGYWQAIADGMDKLPPRDAHAALRRLAVESGLPDDYLVDQLLGEAPDSAKRGGAFTAYSKVKGLLEDGLAMNEKGAKAEARVLEETGTLRKMGAGIGDTRLQGYISLILDIADGKVGLDDPAVAETMAALGVAEAEEPEEITLSPEMQTERDRLVKLLGEIEGMAEEPDLADRKEAIMGSPAFGDFMGKHGLTNPAQGWRLLNHTVREVRKSGGLLERTAPAPLPEATSTAPATAEDVTWAPSVPTVEPVAAKVAQKDEPQAKAKAAVQGATSAAPAALTDLAAMRRKLTTKHISDRLGLGG